MGAPGTYGPQEGYGARLAPEQKKRGLRGFDPPGPNRPLAPRKAPGP